MSWERDPLWAKAKLFFERAFDESRDEPIFGLYCSFGLELLARSALAAISPTLLAEPDKEHRHLLHALDRGSARVQKKSIPATQVFDLCRKLYAEFTDDDYKASLALINRRNEELHTGGAAFDEYRPNQWLAGFYHACHSLSSSIDESLESLFGEEEAKVASDTIIENRNDVKQKVESSIASHRRVFENGSEPDRTKATEEAERLGEELSGQRHHRVDCPACQCVATVQGRAFGKEHVSHEDDFIIERQAVIPTSFECSACGLKLEGYAQLDVAGLGGRYQRRTTWTPDDYYGLIDPDNIGDYLADMAMEYDNE